MTADWGFAAQIGGMGFGIVFAVLIILAIAIWLTGLVTKKIGTSKDETSEQKGG